MDIRNLLLPLLLFGCINEVPYENSCATAENGKCDELSTCPLGSDSLDCTEACSETWTSELIGVCSHDMAALNPDDDAIEGIGSNGNGGIVGTWDSTVTVRGAQSNQEVERHFRTYVPRRINPDTPIPLIFVLGGFSVDMYWLAEFTEFNRMADREEFIVVYGHPEWRDFGSYDVFSWYVYDNAWQGGWPENPDIHYMEAILDQLSNLYNIDLSRVYVSGHSRGAALSIIAAFERPDLFAGWCAQAGFVSANDYNSRIGELLPEDMVPGVLVHGESDPDVSVSNSDEISSIFSDSGMEYGDNWTYFKIPDAKHEWQSQYNQQVWDFLFDRPNLRIVQ
jgi:predicted peptidase